MGCSMQHNEMFLSSRCQHSHSRVGDIIEPKWRRKYKNQRKYLLNEKKRKTIQLGINGHHII